MRLKDLFSLKNNNSQKQKQVKTQEKIETATCVLLLEIAKADEHFSKVEQQIIIKTLRNKFALKAAEIKDLISQSEKVIDESIDFWQFTNRLNEHFTKEEKLLILESAWEIIFSDNKLDGNEDYLIHKFANLLRLSHSELIETKLKVEKQVRAAETVS